MPALPGLPRLLLALGVAQAPVAAIGSEWLKTASARERLLKAGAAEPFSAHVFADLAPGSAPPAKKEAELLRFVTAYRTGLEAVVDATPYAPLLRALAADAAGADSTTTTSHGNLTFYAFIDTWVNNETGHDVLYLNNVTGQCTPLRKSDGNGWSLHLDLLLWPRTTVDTRPRESLTLASGYYGSNYRFGDITLVQGEVVDNGAAVLLDASADFDNVLGDPPVYSCPNGPGDLSMPSLLGYAAQQAAFLSRRYGQDSEERVSFSHDLLEMLVYPELSVVNVTGVFNATSSVVASYDPAKLSPTVGMPVFYEELDVYTDMRLSTMWLNATYPFNKSGEVVSIQNNTMVIALLHPCLPRGSGLNLPRLLIPKNSSHISDKQALVDGLMQWAEDDRATKVAMGMLGEGFSIAATEPLFLEPKAAVLLERPLNRTQTPKEMVASRVLGRVNKTAGAPTSDSKKKRFPLFGGLTAAGVNASKTCVVQRRRQGHLFARDFALKQLEAGDRVVMQLTVTGHGWAMTTEQCGEYCHAVYHLSFNGRSTANVSQFRDDCPRNPINGSMQFGTWDEKRNGWCPGSVEPGFFMDITDWVKEGNNSMKFDVAVWSNRTGEYEPYTDYAGFAYGDQASLIVGLSLFVYSAPAAAAVRSASPRSAAELALLAGSSAPERLRPRRLAEVPAMLRLVQEAKAAPTLRRARHSRKLLSPPLGGASERSQPETVLADAAKSSARTRTTAGGFDFEARAPWYMYNGTVEGFPGLDTGAVAVPVFSGALVQGASRTVKANVSVAALPADWGKAALYLRLTKPPGELQYDHWDRVGSIGLLVNGKHVADGTLGL